MKKSLVTTFLFLTSANAFAGGVAEYFSERNVCARKVKKEIGMFEKFNPGKLKQLNDYKIELERMQQMEQLRELAIQKAKEIEKENNDNMTIESFFASDKPIKERMKDRSDTYHPLSGVPINEIIDSGKVKVKFNPSVGHHDPQEDQMLESKTMTWFDHKNSQENKLVLNIDFEKPEVNCSWEQLPSQYKIYPNFDEAKVAYEKAIQEGKDTDYIDYESEHYRKINGKPFRKDCDIHPLATSGRVRVIVSKNDDGTFAYSTEIGETNLVNRYDDAYDKDLKNRSEHLAEIGFVERLMDAPPSAQKPYYKNGLPTNRIKNEKALEAWVDIAQAKYTEYFEKTIGKDCYKSYLEGEIYIPQKNLFGFEVTQKEKENFAAVQGLNRGVASNSNKKENQDTVTSRATQGGTQTSQSLN